eukprot:1152453-Pelagomonas_calceolata.AAC.4
MQNVKHLHESCHLHECMWLACPALTVTTAACRCVFLLGIGLSRYEPITFSVKSRYMALD